MNKLEQAAESLWSIYGRCGQWERVSSGLHAAIMMISSDDLRAYEDALFLQSIAYQINDREHSDG